MRWRLTTPTRAFKRTNELSLCASGDHLHEAIGEPLYLALGIKEEIRGRQHCTGDNQEGSFFSFHHRNGFTLEETLKRAAHKLGREVDVRYLRKGLAKREYTTKTLDIKNVV